MGTRSRAGSRPRAATDPSTPRDVDIAYIAQLMLSESSPTAVLHAVADALGHAVPHEVLTLYAADPLIRLLRPALVRDARPDASVTTGSLRYGQGVIGAAAESRKPQVVTSPHLASGNGHASGNGSEPHSLIVAPLMARGELKGVLCLYRFGNDALFTDEEFKTAVRFSVLAALAMDNADIRSNLENLAMTDHLTGLCNHRYFHERLLEEVSRANRRDGPVSLLIYDIDDFKNVNDSYGHLLGDQVLRGVASAAKGMCRVEEPVCRIGGEEFAVILPGQFGPQAAELAERIRRSVLELSFPMHTRVTVSLGLAEVPTNASNPRDLFVCADLALRSAKAQGKNCVYTYLGSPPGSAWESAADYPMSGRWEILAQVGKSIHGELPESMMKTWLIRLELARDDAGALSDEEIDALTKLLAEGEVKPELTRGNSGTVVVHMTIDARDDMAAKSAAERMLRDGANTVWSARGLPPFTIAFVDATEGPR